MQEKIERLENLLESFRGTKVLVLGDLILDCYLRGSVERISPEAPVPVVEISEETYLPGGAGNVACNIKSLGGEVLLVGVVGKDAEGEKLKKLLNLRGISLEGVVEDDRPTTLKTRVIAHAQQVVRLDREMRDSVPSPVEERMKEILKEKLREIQVVAISDYGKGAITQEIVNFLRNSASIPVLVDPKVKNMHLYKGFYLISPNWKETREFLHKEGTPSQLARELKKLLEVKNVLITLGEKGMYLQGEEGELMIPAHAREVYDVTGAGDTVIGIISLGVGSGKSLRDAAVLANLGAGIVVGKLGTAQPSPEEIRKAIREFQNEIRDYL